MLALVLKRSSHVSNASRGLYNARTISSHAGLAGNASGDENDLGTLQALAETRWSWVIALDGRLGVDVADIGGDTCRG